MRTTSLRGHVRWIALALALVSAQAAATLVLAQDDDEEAEGEGDDATASAAPAAPPRTTGRGDASGVVGPAGMTFELHSKARLVVPPGLPTGPGRRMRFAESRERPANDAVAPGFSRLGPVLSFDGAINATSAPVVVSVPQPRDPARAGVRIVLAMEQPALCREGAPRLPGSSSLCSGWELVPARYDASERRLSAEMPTPGGYRLVFGTVPDAAPSE